MKKKKTCAANAVPVVDNMDHVTWWTAFIDITSALPDELALSDAPIHLVCGQRLSVRDCAKRAIDLAQRQDPDLASTYARSAQKLMDAYNRRVITQVRTRLRQKRRAYLPWALVQAGLCLLFSLLYRYFAPTSHVLIILAVVAGALFLYAGARLTVAYVAKARILKRSYPQGRRPRSSGSSSRRFWPR